MVIVSSTHTIVVKVVMVMYEGGATAIFEREAVFWGPIFGA